MKYALFALLICVAPLQVCGEAVPFDLLEKFMPPSPTIVEAGAQFGEDTAWMSKLWPDGKLYAFEPSPDTYQDLVRNTQQLSNVTCVPLALSDGKGTHDFYVAGGASSLLKPTDSFNNDYFHADLAHPITVMTTTIDDWAYEHNVGRIDFMWLDMEGNELNALKGALRMLPQVKLIYTEVNLQNFWHGCVQVDELAAWLQAQGFVKIWEDITPHWHGNMLFLNTKVTT